MAKNMRPVVFVGSSKEGLPVARAIQQNLDHEAEVILWSQGVFGLSVGTLETLVDKSRQFDFAVLVLTPDDMAFSHGESTAVPRDNVVFELGFFIGCLGRSRTFIVYDRTSGIKLPSDLAGITTATYTPPEAGSLISALGASSSNILNAIQSQGKLARPSQEVYIDQTTQFKVVAGLLNISGHQFFILMHEAGASLYREMSLMLGIRYEYEIKSDTRTGGGSGYFDVNMFCDQLADADLLTADLRGRVGLSERGHKFADWLKASGYKAQYFWSDIGTWGMRPALWKGRPHIKDRPRNMIELQKESTVENSAERVVAEGAK